MKQALAVLVLATTLPACGLFEKLTGGGDEKQAIQETPSPKPVASIPPEQLALLMPQLEGWEMQPAKSEFVQVGEHKASSATRAYFRKVEELELSAKLQIIDGAYASDIYGPLARMAHSKPGDPHKMAITIGGHSGIQDWQPAAGKVNVALVVARRFLITLEGQNLTPGVVQALLQGIDVKKLAAWAGDEPAAAPVK